MNISMNGSGVMASKPLGGGQSELSFHLDEPSKQRGTVHGLLTIAYNDITLAWSRGNIERQDDRTRLANKAYTHLSPGLQADYDKKFLQHDLDIFCKGAWTVFVNAQMPELVSGDAMSSPLVFLVDPFVIRGGGTILFAPPGRGKSYTGMTMAVCVDAGLDHIFRVSQAPTIYINLERSGSSMKRRLGAINGSLTLEPSRPLYMLNARGRSLSDVIEPLKRAIDKYGIKFAVLDSISRSGKGDLVANEVANSIIDVLNGAVESWLGLAHTPRADESHVFGGIHFEAGADLMVKLATEQQGNVLGVGMEITKANDVGPRPMSVLRFEFDENDLPWSISKARTSDFPELLVGRKMNLADELEEWLLNEVAIGKATATQAAKALEKNRGDVSSTFNNNPRFSLVNKIGVESFYAVKSTQKQ